MAPKRSRAAAAASRPISASQPEPQRPTRTSGRKRSYSDASNISDAPSSQGSTTSALKTEVKRRKKTRVTVETETPVIPEEQEEEYEGFAGEPAAPTCDGPSETEDPEASEAEESIQVFQASTHRQVHFDTATEDTQESTATNITPHPRKMTIKRRSFSPSLAGETKRLKTTRSSLPATLTQDADANPEEILQQWRFAPLQHVLGERMRRILQMKNQPPQSELDHDGDQDMTDIDMLVLDGKDEIKYPERTPPGTPHINGERKSKPGLSTEASGVRMAWNNERTRLEDAVDALAKEANAATAKLRVLLIELGALGFTEVDFPNANARFPVNDGQSLQIIHSIREAFDVVRDFYAAELPHALPDDPSNRDLLDIMIADLREFAERLRIKHNEALEKGTLAADLGHQVDALLDHLAEKEIKNENLTRQWKDLDKSNEAKTKTITELEDDLQITKNELNSEVEKTGTLETENSEFEKTIERLKTSLEDYRAVETDLQEKIDRLENEHRNTVSQMNKEREETVRDLEDKLDAENIGHNNSQKLADERNTTIAGLEENIAALETERDGLLEELDTTKAERDEETQAKETAQADLEEKSIEVEDLETRVDRLDEQLNSLNEELEELRTMNEAERRQREAAENELDHKNQEADQLTQKLHASGQEANQLRMKIFELQNKNTELAQNMSDRDEQYQEDMANEVERREAADMLAQERATTISDLQDRLAEVERDMANLIAEKEERISQLEDEVGQKEAELQNLEESYKREVQQMTERIEDLNGGIAVLQDTIDGHVNTIHLLQQQAMDHQSQTEDRDRATAELNHRIAQLEAEKSDLAGEKEGLERRVESEAEQMLQVQNDMSQEVADLKETIRDKVQKIHAVEEKSRAAEVAWEELLQARDDEIFDLREELNTNAATHNETVINLREDIEQVKTSSAARVDGLNEQNEEVKRKFKAYVRRSTDTIDRLQQELARATAAVDEEGDNLKDEGEDMLKQLDALNVPNGTLVAHASSQNVVKKCRGRKKRVADSGIGLGREEADEESMMIEQA